MQRDERTARVDSSKRVCWAGRIRRHRSDRDFASSGRRTEQPRPARAPPAVEAILAAQRSAGNQAVARVLARTIDDAKRYIGGRGIPPPAPDTLASWVDLMQSLHKNNQWWESRHVLNALVRDLPRDDATYVLARVDNNLTDAEFQALRQQREAEESIDDPISVDEDEQSWSDDDGSMSVDRDDRSDSDDQSDQGGDDPGDAPSIRVRFGDIVAGLPPGADQSDYEEPGEDAESDYEDEYDDAPKTKSKKRKRAQKLLPGTVTSSTTFKEKGARAPKKRRTSSVTGNLDTITTSTGRVIQRPTSITGIVEPQATTGRPGAPEPLSIRVGVKWAEVGGESRDTGIVDAQKGHLMGLELGGPDVAWNIVPQWANFQANGAWRKAEKRVYEMAMAAQSRGRQLVFKVQVLYKSYERPQQGSQKGLTFPTGFTMTVTEQDVGGGNQAHAMIVYDDEQFQDQTDMMMFQRVSDELEGWSFDDDVKAQSKGKKKRWR